MQWYHRCGWVNLDNPLYVAYHDHEWWRPLHDERALFELLCLEWAQAGLSWQTILNRREDYRKMFWNFDVETILTYSDEALLERMKQFNIIKNKLKVIGVRKNALAYKKVREDHGSLDTYLWNFVGAWPIRHDIKTYQELPASTELSHTLSRSLKKYGFTFVGPTICYAFMQAAGLVNDHEVNCFFR